jgi:hypothetical protein
MAIINSASTGMIQSNQMITGTPNKLIYTLELQQQGINTQQVQASG